MKHSFKIILLGVMYINPALAQMATDLHDTLQKVCNNITSVSIGDPLDKTSWKLKFKENTSDDCKNAAYQALSSYNYIQPKLIDERIKALETKTDSISSKIDGIPTINNFLNLK